MSNEITVIAPGIIVWVLIIWSTLLLVNVFVGMRVAKKRKEWESELCGLLIDMSELLREVTESEYCEVCGGDKVNFLVNCEECESKIEISNWRDEK